MEQVFARPEDIRNHVTATSLYRDFEDRLSSMAGRIRTHVEERAELDIDPSGRQVGVASSSQ